MSLDPKTKALLAAARRREPTPEAPDEESRSTATFRKKAGRRSAPSPQADPGLAPEAKALLDAAAPHHEPTAEDASRNFAALARRLAEAPPLEPPAAPSGTAQDPDAGSTS